MTKPLAKDQFRKFKELMGIKNWKISSNGPQTQLSK